MLKKSLTTNGSAASAEELDGARTYARRVRRLKIHAAAWLAGTILVTALWVLHEWQANGAFERFAHEGGRGDWNPTLWALVTVGWALVVAIMALRVRFERPVTADEVGSAVVQLVARGTYAHATYDELRRFARWQLEGVRRLKFHASAWAVGTIALVPLNALVEWQDNGAFVRISNDSQPGSWDPWFLYVGGVWAGVIALLALWTYAQRPRPEVGTHRLRLMH